MPSTTSTGKDRRRIDSEVYLDRLTTFAGDEPDERLMAANDLDLPPGSDQRGAERSREWSDVTGRITGTGGDERIEISRRAIDHPERDQRRASGQREAR